jgi:hypothetical protein
MIDKMPTPAGTKTMWALRLSDEEKSKLQDIQRVTRATKTAFFRWCINAYWQEHVLGNPDAVKVGMPKKVEKSKKGK